MIDPTDLAGLTVESFWQGFNWLGLPPEPEVSREVPDEPKDWLAYSVAEFLALANWSGRARAIDPPRATAAAPPLLTLSEEEYFQSLPWRGKTHVHAAPKVKSRPATEPSPNVNRDFNANDLSNLF